MASIGQALDGAVDTVAPAAMNAGGVAASGGKAVGRGSLKAGKLTAKGVGTLLYMVGSVLLFWLIPFPLNMALLAGIILIDYAKEGSL